MAPSRFELPDSPFLLVWRDCEHEIAAVGGMTAEPFVRQLGYSPGFVGGSGGGSRAIAGAELPMAVSPPAAGGGGDTEARRQRRAVGGSSIGGPDEAHLDVEQRVELRTCRKRGGGGESGTDPVADLLLGQGAAAEQRGPSDAKGTGGGESPRVSSSRLETAAVAEQAAASRVRR